MSEWNCYGSDKITRFDRDLYASALERELDHYQQYLGDDFTIDHLLKIYEIKANMEIAGAIIDFPELMMHQVGIYEGTYDVPGIGRSIQNLTGAICEAIEEGRFDRNKEDK